MGAHVRAATALPMVQPEFDVPPDPDLVSAVMRCVTLRKGSELAEWRECQIRDVHEISDNLGPFGDFISSLMSGSSASIASHVNLAMMSCIVEALDFPDVACVSRWFLGHAVVGDIPDSGLFRPCLTELSADPAEILSPASNRLWNAKPIASIEHQTASATPEQIEILRGVERQTRKELSQEGTHGPLRAYACPTPQALWQGQMACGQAVWCCTGSAGGRIGENPGYRQRAWQ